MRPYERGLWMYKLCKTEQSANRQRELEQGLLAAMAVSPFDEISISDLCDRIGVPRKSFYRYFSGKEGALHALIDHTLMHCEMKNIYFGGASPEWDLEDFFRFWKEQQPLLSALQTGRLYDVLVTRAIEYALAEGPRQSGGSRADATEREHTIVFVVSGLMTLVVRWHHGGYRESVQQMARIAGRVLSKPLTRL